MAMMLYLYLTILGILLSSKLPVTISKCASANQSVSYEVYYEWNQVDFDFPNSSFREDLIRRGEYVQINCIPTAIKIYKNQMFITTPRYKNGVPSTLNVIPYKESSALKRTRSGPNLTPFPSWEMQEIGNCSALQLVQATELDSFNRLWIVDAGRVEVLTLAPRNLCPAKLVIVDLENGNKIDRIYEFPDDVAPRDGNAIKDIQVVCKSRDDCISYISNLNGTSSLIVYDYKTNDSWFATHALMQADLEQSTFLVAGVLTTAPFGITGLGLTPKSTEHSHIFFSKIAGDHIYRLSTKILNNRKLLKENPNLEDGIIEDLGEKPSGQADGGAMDNKGNWFFGSLPESAVYNINSNQISSSANIKLNRVINSNNEEINWPDTFSFDSLGNLLLSTTNFQRFASPLPLINPLEINYRVIRFKTNSVSYQF